MKTNFTNLQQKQSLLRGLIFTLVTVVIWVSLSVFRSQRKTAISADLTQLADPLNPNIDMSVIDRIEKKTAYSDEELANFTIYRLVRNKEGEEQIVTDLRSINASSAPSAAPTAVPTSAPVSSPLASPLSSPAL